ERIDSMSMSAGAAPFPEAEVTLGCPRRDDDMGSVESEAAYPSSTSSARAGKGVDLPEVVLQRTDGATPFGYTSTMIPFSILDLAPIAVGATAADALGNSLDLARHAEALGYRRFWLAEHHNMPGIASSATA